MSPSFNIMPRVGVNCVRFNMLRTEIRALIGEPSSSFTRGKGTEFASPTPIDIYGDGNVFFNYDKSNTLEAVEFTDEAKLSVSHHPISKLSYKALKAQILAWDPTAIVDETGCSFVRSDTLGIITGEKWDEEIYQSVLAYRDGYWDEYDAKQRLKT